MSTAAGPPPYRQTYTYDPAGNRLLKDSDGTRTSYAYDVANKLRYAEAPGGRTTYTFDANGNQQIEREPTGDRTTTIWDYENQPSGMLLPNGNRLTAIHHSGRHRVVARGKEQRLKHTLSIIKCLLNRCRCPH